MDINKRLFEDILSGKLKGTFVLRNKQDISSDNLIRNNSYYSKTHPYRLWEVSYTPNGLTSLFDWKSDVDIIDFIPVISDTDMKENELTIEIPKGKIVDWDESKKQNKIVLKDKQLTYEDICKKLFPANNFYYINENGKIVKSGAGTRPFLLDANNATTAHQLECILAKNKLANVAKYLNDAWEPICGTSVWIIVWDCYLGYHATSVQVGSIALKCYGLVIFKSEELAQQAIEILGEETVKLALESLGI